MRTPQDPTAEVVLSVEIKVRITDTELNETKEVALNEYVSVDARWLDTYDATLSYMTEEMRGLVEAMEIERFKRGG